MAETRPTRRTERQPRPRYRNHTQGQDVPGARLTPAMVVAIREAYALGATLRELGAQYGVSHVAICHVCTRRRWAHVPATDQEQVDLGEVPECQDIIETTGRIIHEGTIYSDIRRAEVATGIDRIVIATLLRTAGSGWTYEPGTYAEPPDLWASAPWPCDGHPSEG